jgi:hypothetical protein
MLIQSDFKDYYDCIQSYGQDRSLVYKRFSSVITIRDYPFFIWGDNNNIVNFDSFALGFCGKLFKGIKIHFIKTDEKLYSFDFEEVYYIYSSYGSRKSFYWNNKRNNLKRYFDSAENQTFVNKIFLDNTTPIFYIEDNRFGSEWRSTNQPYQIHINYNLSKINFQKVVDPYSCFQNISIYLGGLAHPEKPLPRIPDKIMSEIKGFDKYSFRKRKSI